MLVASVRGTIPREMFGFIPRGRRGTLGNFRECCQRDRVGALAWVLLLSPHQAVAGLPVLAACGAWWALQLEALRLWCCLVLNKYFQKLEVCLVH